MILVPVPVLVSVLGRVIERGLAADQRLIRFTATVSDRPGGIASLTRDIADTGASVKVGRERCVELSAETRLDSKMPCLASCCCFCVVIIFLK
jgi:hypothetical protein